MNMTIEQTQTADGLFKRKSSPEKTHPLTLIGKRGDDGVTNEAPITPNLKLPPWLNDDGSFKSDEEIQSLGKNWSAETWDSYLKVNVGDVEAEDHDLVFFPFVDTETVNFGAELLKTLRTQDDYENLPEAFEFALTFLSDREAQVIRMRYLKELSQEEISERLGVGLNSIKSFRRKGLKKLRHLLPSEEFRTKYQEHIKHLKRKCHPNVTPESL
jgi:RNA polymerase sigma factor (sigma-70 family)